MPKGAAAPAQPVQPQRHDQTAGGMPADQHPRTGVVVGDDRERGVEVGVVAGQVGGEVRGLARPPGPSALVQVERVEHEPAGGEVVGELGVEEVVDRKSTRLNSSHVKISYAVFCLKKKNSSS